MKANADSYDLSWAGRIDGAYDEEAFGYFLAVEQERADRASRSCLLLLVDLKGQAGTNVHIDSEVADKLFSGLSLCLRETDFMGWYRDGRVAAAVLTQHADVIEAEVFNVICERVRRALFVKLPSAVAERVRVRVLGLSASSKPGALLV